MKTRYIDSIWNRDVRNDINYNFKTLENNFNNVVDIVSDEAFEKVVDSAKLNYLEPVQTFSDIATTYPNPAEGDAVMTRDDGKVYRYYVDGGWKWKLEIEVSPINEVDNRLTDELTKKVDNSLFLDIETQKHRFNNETDYYITQIPFGFKPKLGIANDELGTLQSTIDFARMSKSSICINAGLFNVNTGAARGVVIKDSVVLQDEFYTNSNGAEVLAIDATGMLSSYDSNTTTASFLLANGAVNTVQGWYPVVKDGAYVGGRDPNNFEPIQVIGQKTNGDYVILTCDGRTQYDKGLSMENAADILISYGVNYAYNLDGGGSTSTVNKMIKQNKNIDNMTVDRKVSTFLYFAKDIDNNNVFDAFNEIAKLKQDLNDKLIKLTHIESGYLQLKGKTGFNYPGVEFYRNGESTRLGKLELSTDNGYKGTFRDGGTERTLLQANLNGLYDIKGKLGDFHSVPTFVSDCNTVRGSGMFKVNNTTLNLPYTPSAGYQGFLFNSDFDDDNNANILQILIGRTSLNMFRREIAANGNPGPWENYPTRAAISAYRPTSAKAGFNMFDDTLGKPIWWNGVSWLETMGRFVNPPTSTTSSGVLGDFSADDNYFYVCKSNNRWKRIAFDSSW